MCVVGGGGRGTSRRTGTQTNRIDNPEINSNMYSQMIFNKGANNIQWGKKYSFSQMMLGNLDTHMPKNEDEPLAYTIYKN